MTEDVSEQARFAEATYRMLESGNKDERIARINNDLEDTNYKVIRQHSNRDFSHYEMKLMVKQLWQFAGLIRREKKQGLI